MHHPPDPVRRAGSPHRRIRLGLLIGASVALLALTGVGTYGLMRGARHPNVALSSPGTTQGPASPGGHNIRPILPASLPQTSDRVVFARAVTHALFTWDTTASLGLDDYQQPLIRAADPSGTDTPGLIQDVLHYFPAPDVWSQLSDYQTRQSITIDTLAVPHQWPRILRDAGGRLQDGVSAYTVKGTRRRYGVWLGETFNSQHPVSFTMFLACPPATKQCTLLRLSELDNPLH